MVDTSLQNSANAPKKRGRGRPKLTQPSKEFRIRRQQILLAFSEAFSRTSYHNTSIQEVVDLAGIPKANLFYYFPSKTHILYALMDQKLDSLLEEFSTLLSIENAKDLIRVVMNRQIKLATEQDQIIETFMTARPDLKGELADSVSEKQEKYLGFLDAVVERGMKAGIIPEGNVRILAISIFNMPYTIYRWNREVGASKEDVANDLLKLIGVE